MSTPVHYPTTLTAVGEALTWVSRGEAREIGSSAGGRPLWAVSYGKKEPVNHLADLSSALDGRQPEAFFGKRERPVMLITNAVHGAEMESIAGALNLLRVLETGADLKGQDWPELRAAAEEVRLVIVPCVNPDGRARIPHDDPTQWTHDMMQRFRHGLHKDGNQLGENGCKVPHPRDPRADGFLAGTFNDLGVNPQHGVFLSPEVARETHALLALEETPDFVLDCHSCGSGPFVIVGGPGLPERVHRRQAYLDGAFRRALRDRLGIHRRWGANWGEDSVLSLDSAYYHLCGALPLIFESGDGTIEPYRWTHTQIVDTYLTVVETVLVVGVREGLRP